jgi:hypothetical protein
VLAFQKPDAIGDYSLPRDIRKGRSKGRKALIAFGPWIRAGVFRLAGIPRSCPRLQALCEET